MQAVLSCHAAACTQVEYTSEGVAQQQFGTHLGRGWIGFVKNFYRLAVFEVSPAWAFDQKASCRSA